MGKQAGIRKLDYLLRNLKLNYKNNVDEKFWDTFRNSINVDDLVNLWVEIYDKYYTEEDIDKLTDFYLSPLGKKVLKNTPIIFVESMEASQKWEKEIFEKAKREILLK